MKPTNGYKITGQLQNTQKGNFMFVFYKVASSNLFYTPLIETYLEKSLKQNIEIPFILFSLASLFHISKAKSL